MFSKGVLDVTPYREWQHPYLPSLSKHWVVTGRPHEEEHGDGEERVGTRG